MKILITGGGGFLGARLARTLLARGQLDGQGIETLVLADQQAVPSDLQANPQVQSLTGPLLGQVGDLVAGRPDAVFHLASAVSGECEADFDLGLRSNIDSTRALLDAFRQAQHQVRFVFPVRWPSMGRMPDTIGRAWSAMTHCPLRKPRMAPTNSFVSIWWPITPAKAISMGAAPA